MVERRLIAVEGVVQGVGFRPYVHRLAAANALRGSVRNDAGGVLIDVEGDGVSPNIGQSDSAVLFSSVARGGVALRPIPELALVPELVFTFVAPNPVVVIAGERAASLDIYIAEKLHRSRQIQRIEAAAQKRIGCEMSNASLRGNCLTNYRRRARRDERSGLLHLQRHQSRIRDFADRVKTVRRYAERATQRGRAACVS